MSEYGLKINNTVITNTYSNYSLYSIIDINFHSVSGRKQFYFSYTLPSEEALFFIDCGYNGIGLFSRVNNDITLISNSSFTTKMYVYIFGNYLKNNSNYGIQIFDSQGKTNFDSRCIYLRPVGQIISAITDHSDSLTYNGQINGKLMLMPTSLSRLMPLYIPHLNISATLCRLNYNIAETFNVSINNDAPITDANMGSFLIADVKI